MMRAAACFAAIVLLSTGCSRPRTPDRERETSSPASEQRNQAGPSEAAKQRLIEEADKAKRIQEAVAGLRGDLEQHIASSEYLIENAPDPLPIFLEALVDNNMTEKASILECIAAVAHKDPQAVFVLAMALNDRRWVIRSAAARALGSLKDRAKPVLGYLITSTHEEEHRGTVASKCEALVNISPTDERVFAVLVRAYHQSVNASASIISSISKCQSNRPEVLKLLKEAITSSPNGYTRGMAVEGLENVSDLLSIDDLTLLHSKIKDDEDVLARSAFVRVVSEFYRSHGQGKQVLSHYLEDHDKTIRKIANQALTEKQQAAATDLTE